MVSGAGKPLAALGATLALVAIALAALGASPGATLTALVEGAFGNWLAATDTLVKTTPLIFTGLAVSVAFSGSLWNIGAEGQLLVGALAAAACGIHLVFGIPVARVTVLTMALSGALDNEHISASVTASISAWAPIWRAWNCD